MFFDGRFLIDRMFVPLSGVLLFMIFLFKKCD